MVGKRLWIAVGSQCHIFNMKSHKVGVCDHEHEYLTRSVCDAPVWLIFRLSDNNYLTIPEADLIHNIVLIFYLSVNIYILTIFDYWSS